MFLCYYMYMQWKRSTGSDIKADVAGAEVKILIIASTFLLLFLLITVTNSVFIMRANSITSDIQAHFECEAKGRQSGPECSRESFDSLHTIFHTICSILPSYFVLVLMIYIVDFSSLRKWFLCRPSLKRHHCHQTHTHNVV